MGRMKGIDDVKVTTALDYTSGTADRTGAIIDMSGYDGVLMMVKLAAVTTSGTNSIYAQSGAASNLSDAQALAGTKIDIADDDDNQIFIIDLFQPAEQYVRLYVDKDTSHACAESAIYIQYGAHSRPVNNTVTDAVTYERHSTPDEGTA